MRFQFRELRNINNRNENITENVFRFLFLAFRILCVPCSGRRKLTEAEKKENVFVSVFPVNGKRFLYLFLRRTVTGKGKMKTDKPVNLVVRFSFFLLPFSSKRKMQNGQSNGKRKLEQEEYFPFCVLHFGKNEKMYTENSFRFTFLLSVFLRKWNCYFFCFVFQFRLNGDQESENWNMFSVLVFLFDSGWRKMKRKTDKPKRSPLTISVFLFSFFCFQQWEWKQKTEKEFITRFAFVVLGKAEKPKTLSFYVFLLVFPETKKRRFPF